MEQAQVLQWVTYAEADLWSSSFAWILSATGLSAPKEVRLVIINLASDQLFIVFLQFQIVNDAKKEVLGALKLLNDFLLTRTYLVGERITLADIALAVTVLPLYQTVLEPSVRKPFVNVTRWFTTLVNQKQFVDVLGKVELTTKLQQLQAPKPLAKGADAKKDKKPEAAPAGDEEISLTPKPKDPFLKFPAG